MYEVLILIELLYTFDSINIVCRNFRFIFMFSFSQIIGMLLFRIHTLTSFKKMDKTFLSFSSEFIYLFRGHTIDTLKEYYGLRNYTIVDISFQV